MEAEETLLEKYNKELTDFFAINEFNVKEVQLRLPGVKHLFVTRLIKHKQLEQKLKKAKENAKNRAAKEIEESSPVLLSSGTVQSAIEKSETIQKINQQIIDNSFIIEFLERTEKILSSTTYDIKNIVEITKMEAT